MDLTRYQRILGKTFIDQLKVPVLIIGIDIFSAPQMASELGVTNTVAGRKLTKIAKDLKAKSITDLYRRTSPYTFADTDAGVTTLLVLFRAFEWKDLSVEAWYNRKRSKTIQSFLYFKSREAKAKARTRRRK